MPRRALKDVETLADAVNRLTAAGYEDDYRAEPNGLRAVGTGCVHAPESLIIDEVVRFEGSSNPDDEAIVFALRCEAQATRGTYVIAYGAQTPALDAEMTRRLRVRAA